MAVRVLVELLTRQLANYEPEAYALNGFLIDILIRLKAVEAAEVIERAFAAEVVEERIVNWADVRRALGVEGLGLVPERKTTSLRSMFQPLPLSSDDAMFEPPFEFKQVPVAAPAPARGDHDRPQENKERAKKEKAKRKQQEKAKKRNRKKR